jgi:hypothetical protein
MTLRIQTKVLPGHKIEIDAPDLPVGEPVEVTVTAADAPAEPPAQQKPLVIISKDAIYTDDGTTATHTRAG